MHLSNRPKTSPATGLKILASCNDDYETDTKNSDFFLFYQGGKPLRPQIGSTSNPGIQAAAFEVKAKMSAQKAAFNLPNPEINAESPTGEFYAVGVLQSFDFPTVYGRQKQVAKAETGLAQAGQRIQENELRYQVRSLYLEAQVAEYQSRQWADRDSLYAIIASTAVRQFSAGEIDFLQKTWAENEAGKVHQERIAADQNRIVLYQNLSTLTGLADLGTLLPFAADTESLDSDFELSGSPSIVYAAQTAKVAERQVDLAKSRALPNFAVGYLNQGPRNTPMDYRFRASMGIPLWAGQYSASAKAAKAETQAAVARTQAQSQAVLLESQRARTAYSNALAMVQYQEREALPRAQSMIAAAVRMQASGQVDYVTFLRTLDAAFSIRRDYVEQLKALNSARISIRYLLGQ